MEPNTTILGFDLGDHTGPHGECPNARAGDRCECPAPELVITSAIAIYRDRITNETTHMRVRCNCCMGVIPRESPTMKLTSQYTDPA